MKERIGFIGVDATGLGVAGNVLAKGGPLTVHADRRRDAIDRRAITTANGVSLMDMPKAAK